MTHVDEEEDKDEEDDDDDCDGDDDDDDDDGDVKVPQRIWDFFCCIDITCIAAALFVSHVLSVALNITLTTNNQRQSNASVRILPKHARRV